MVICPGLMAGTGSVRLAAFVYLGSLHGENFHIVLRHDTYPELGPSNKCLDLCNGSNNVERVSTGHWIFVLAGADVLS